MNKEQLNTQENRFRKDSREAIQENQEFAALEKQVAKAVRYAAKSISNGGGIQS